MKKSIIALAALPAIFGAVGYGAGKMLEPAPATAAAPVQHASDKSAAEEALDRLAKDTPAHAADGHDDSFAGPRTSQAQDHEARLIPASATAPATHDTHATPRARCLLLTWCVRVYVLPFESTRTKTTVGRSWAADFAAAFALFCYLLCRFFCLSATTTMTASAARSRGSSTAHPLRKAAWPPLGIWWRR